MAAKRLDGRAVTAVDTAMGVLVARWFEAMPARRRAQLEACRPSIDLDGTDIETYGRKKERTAWNHERRRVRPAHPATWAEAGVVLAADLGSGPTISAPPRPG